MSRISDSLVGSIKIRSSLDAGLTGTMFTGTKELGRSIELVPVVMTVGRKHPTGCTSTDMITSLSGKPCIDCASYAYRDSTTPCEVEYTLTGLAYHSPNELLALPMSGSNWVTGEALYRLLTSHWNNPWEVALVITSSKAGVLTVKMSPNSPSDLHISNAKAIANEKE